MPSAAADASDDAASATPPARKSRFNAPKQTSNEERLISHFRIFVPNFHATVQILLARGNRLIDNLQDGEPTRANRQRLRSVRRIHRAHCEWAIRRLRAEILRQVVHLKIGQGLALIKERRRLAQPVPPSPSSGDEDD